MQHDLPPIITFSCGIRGISYRPLGFMYLYSDVREQRSLEDEVAMEQWKDVGGVIALATSNCIKPTIVPVNGSAAGFGLTSILSATIRVAWKDAKVSMPFSRRGLTMGSRGAFYLPKLIRTWP
ncbi:Enoyl-CoA hydratase AFT3-1 [Colletotrichum orbiculare MAFF 240422]|uniref:Enoyl-CoA hydratase AFT3-1 n=1 Tax=Colletotrichum orbiculare (strain 104-T / ATCC 96160 / CBS 514.97 / LARS 414 / MAFF 240422) TaxID=1213857 RepID=A0A484FQS7_COLOR|nr:Enoyl-CoA hydratase AFT3-1 [Colletotrichum orbiculare MAFF 240422]